MYPEPDTAQGNDRERATFVDNTGQKPARPHHGAAESKRAARGRMLVLRRDPSEGEELERMDRKNVGAPCRCAEYMFMALAPRGARPAHRAGPRGARPVANAIKKCVIRRSAAGAPCGFRFFARSRRAGPPRGGRIGPSAGRGTAGIAAGTGRGRPRARERGAEGRGRGNGGGREAPRPARRSVEQPGGRQFPRAGRLARGLFRHLERPEDPAGGRALDRPPPHPCGVKLRRARRQVLQHGVPVEGFRELFGLRRLAVRRAAREHQHLAELVAGVPREVCVVVGVRLAAARGRTRPRPGSRRSASFPAPGRSGTGRR